MLSFDSRNFQMQIQIQTQNADTNSEINSDTNTDTNTQIKNALLSHTMNALRCIALCDVNLESYIWKLQSVPERNMGTNEVNEYLILSKPSLNTLE